MPLTSELEHALRGAALRVTQPRVAVLAVVHEHPHADTDTIIGLVRQLILSEVSHQAVYDVLRALTTRRTVAADSSRPARSLGYESRVGDNHHHVVCRSCGDMSLTSIAPSATTPCLIASDDHGFVDRRGRGRLLGHLPQPVTTADRLTRLTHTRSGRNPVSEHHHHDAVVGDMQSEESEAVCPVVHRRTAQPPHRGRRQP